MVYSATSLPLPLHCHHPPPSTAHINNHIPQWPSTSQGRSSRSWSSSPLPWSLCRSSLSLACWASPTTLWSLAVLLLFLPTWCWSATWLSPLLRRSLFKKKKRSRIDSDRFHSNTPKSNELHSHNVWPCRLSVNFNFNLLKVVSTHTFLHRCQQVSRPHLLYHDCTI